MNIEILKKNLEQMKSITRELYVFMHQLTVIEKLEASGSAVVNLKEKKLLNDAVVSLRNQLKILNNSIPQLMTDNHNIGTGHGAQAQNNLVQIKYSPVPGRDKVTLVISEEDKKDFLSNLSKSNLSINQLKKKYSSQITVPEFGKPNSYAKLSNHFFRDFSTKLIEKGYFKTLNVDLRKINSPFVLSTYVSMMLLSSIIGLIVALFVYILLLFVNVSMTFPFFNLPIDDPIYLRALRYIWVIIALPALVGLLFYFSPTTERKSLGSKMNQELPFVAIHMSAIATSGVEPLSIFKIILKSPEYKYTNIEIRKLVNHINFHGYDLVSALKLTAKSSPSVKLRGLLDGLATALTSGGNLHNFLDKHADTLMFDYKIEREKYTKASETFMDIYISICIAAPMILLMLFVIMGSTGTISSFLGLSVKAVGMLIILAIVVLNALFLVFLNMKQPVM